MALATPPRRARASRLALVESKLEPPELRPGAVEKAALVERLRTARAATLVDVVAPAGYGKTTLLAHWAARDRRPFAWLVADDRDNDPRVLLSYVAEALARVVDVDPPARDASSRRGRPGWHATLCRLGAAIVEAPPFVLVVDDAHRLVEPECLEVLALLAEHFRDGSALALGARAEPQLPLARLRAQGRLTEIGPAELRLDDDEAQALLRSAGVEAADGLAAELANRTEGWPAGLFLAGLAVAGDEDGVFVEDDRGVADYLRLEVLSRLSPAEREFVTRASALERMSGPLCDAALERTGSARLLESLERSNAFLVPLDRQRQWYRFHHLFRELLLAELRSKTPDLVRDLSGRAANWCAANGLADAAIGYAHAARDHDRVAALVAEAALPSFDAGDSEAVDRWLEKLDEERCAKRQPAAAAAAGLICALGGRAAEADRWADALAGRGSVHAPEVALLRAALCRQGPERMRNDAALAVEQLGGRRGWRPLALLVLGASYRLEGDLDAADAAFEASAEAAAVEGAALSRSLALAQRSLLARERGEHAESESFARGASSLVRSAGLDGCPAVALVHAAAARAATAGGDSAGARPELLAARRLRSRLGHALPWLALHVRLELAQAHVAVADYAEAKEILAEGQKLLVRRPELGVLVEQLHELQEQSATLVGPAARWASTLTDAELRLLPLLTTHFSFREIGERLFVSRNTVKTQAVSMYRKLGVTSRGEAIEKASELGLVAASAVPERR